MVDARGFVVTRVGFALVDLSLTVGSGVAGVAQTGEGVGAILTGSSVQAGAGINRGWKISSQKRNI